MEPGPAAESAPTSHADGGAVPRPGAVPDSRNGHSALRSPHGAVPADVGGAATAPAVPEADADADASPRAVTGADAGAGQERVSTAAPNPQGIAGLPVRFQVVAAIGLAVIGVVACVQVGMVFLHVAPSNTISKQYGKAVDDWIYPEFEQNWKLFAPNPLQQNIDIQARAELKMPDGSTRTTDWIDFSAQDGAGIRHNPLPSHTQQNEVRRGWDFFVGSHTDDNKPNGLRGELSEQYMRRIVMLRLGAHRDGGTVERIQVRSMTTSVKSPPWSDEKTDTRPSYRVVPWWTVTPVDLPEGAGDAGTEAKR
ncbi:DUF5819 family protein [Streptomyces sp. Edi4]|uniref:DUF5819 family protein n=1 Tax=Streptomyces sp. Edi4 TaxID=3162527 RepID=UPI003305C76B